MQTTVHSEIISKGYNKLIKGFKPFFFLFLLVLFADLKIVNAQIDFDPSPVSGCTPLNVTCTNLTSNPMAYFYRWDFNDGSPIMCINGEYKTQIDSGAVIYCLNPWYLFYDNFFYGCGRLGCYP